MAKILIVDDDDFRSTFIKDKIASKCAIDHAYIDICHNINDARIFLRINYYDVLILDIFLPRRTGDTPDAANVVHLLQEVARRPIYHKPGIIFGVTSFIDEKPLYEEMLNDKMLHIFEAQFNSREWVTDLCNTIINIAPNPATRAEVSDLIVISIHGIQTYGNWQDKLDRCLNSHFKTCEHYAYKYGFYPLLTFIIPFLRFIEVNRFIAQVSPYIDKHTQKKL